MKLKSLFLVPALTLTALAAQAPVPAAAQTVAGKASVDQTRDCFWGRSLNGFRALDNETLLLNVGLRDVYEAKLAAPSVDLKWVNGVALVARGGGNFICSRLDADIVVPGASGMGPQRYPLTSLRRLTPQEVAAIPKKNRP